MDTKTRKQIAAGNWKMNLNLLEANKLSASIASEKIPADVQVILAPAFPFLAEVIRETKYNPNVYVAAQNCSVNENGAYTGETSCSMIKSIGATHVILGHSERRAYHSESDALILEKIRMTLQYDLTPIYCCGESLEIREAGNHIQFVNKQLEESILQLSEEEISKIIIAYEPIWAIGTGKTASPEQAQEIQKEIRSIISNKFGLSIAESLSILYGGSVKPNNAKDIFSQNDVDGGLVGGASLNDASFKEIIHSF